MIDSYRFGQIVVDGQVYESDVLIYPDRVDSNWWRETGHKLSVTDLADVMADPPEVLVVGTGRYGRMSVLPETEHLLAEQDVQLVAQSTRTACETYNRMAAQGKHVVAALHLSC
jgi:hypothetical protein